MGLITRLATVNDDHISNHVWAKLFDNWKRGRVNLTTMLNAYDLTDKEQEISQVFPSTDKLGLSVSHTWENDDGVYLTTTGSLPGGISAETVYYIINSNPGAGTVKISTEKEGSAVNITSTGTGTHTLNRIDADVIYWDETRLDVTSTVSTADQKLRRVVWDEKIEAIGEIAEAGIAFDNETDFKSEMTSLASWLSVS